VPKQKDLRFVGNGIRRSSGRTPHRRLIVIRPAGVKAWSDCETARPLTGPLIASSGGKVQSTARSQQN